MAVAPDDVAFARIDGESANDFRRAFDVEAAPTRLVFRGGNLVDSIRGREAVRGYEALFDEVFG